ncbi:MAG: alcohol dehydrogenase catalytic domain-containing protein [candidate division NC10 bacterium]|nr:alcohol dehydrogenase catalytic domain-containing protein [candidate division NC10 bacterium]
MRAAVLYKPDDLRVEEVEHPTVGPGELVIQVKGCGVCGTDLRVIRGKKKRGVHFPSVIGHEIAGEVVERGSGVQGFQPGDRVAVVPVISCFQCAYCLRDLENLCLNRRAIGYEFDGGFQEYLRLPEVAVRTGNVMKIPERLSFEEASLLEPFACCVNGSQRSNIPLGGMVVIIGAGPIGLMHLKLAKVFGAATVIMSEPAPLRREAALQMGADVAIDPKETDLQQVVTEHTDGIGADTVILAIGIPGLVGDLAKLLRKGGTLNLFAGFEEEAEARLLCNIVHYNQATITGSASSSRFHFQQAIALVGSGRVQLNDLITHRFPLEEIHGALQLTMEGKGLKAIVVP